jgi:hypothetical protein
MATTTELTLLERLTRVAAIYQRGHGLTVHEASEQIFINPRRLSKLNRSRNAQELGDREYAAAMRKMSDTWPASVEWPEDVMRPLA